MSELKDYDIMDIEAMDDERLEKSKSGKIQATRVYIKSEADKVIAELKEKLDEKDKEIAYWRKEYDEETKLTDTLKAEIESLKASHYAEMVDAGMENRGLKRALWLAREWRAWCEGQFWLAIPSNNPRDIYHLSITNRIHRAPEEWMAYWYKVEQLCKKKAEEYK